MRINLDDKEIKIALVEYVSSQGIDISDKNVTVDMVAGRGVNGHSATISIVEVTSETGNNISDLGATSNVEDLPSSDAVEDEKSIFGG